MRCSVAGHASKGVREELWVSGLEWRRSTVAVAPEVSKVQCLRFRLRYEEVLGATGWACKRLQVLWSVLLLSCTKPHA